MRTHSASSLVAARLPAMWGSETLATEVSSTSMKVASMTDAAMTQGLAEGRQAGLATAAVSATDTGASCSVPGRLGDNGARG